MTSPIPERPYDTDQLLQLTAHMDVNGPVIDPPGPPTAPSIVQQPGFEHHTHPVVELTTAVSSLFKLFTPEGRQELRDARATREAHKQAVAAHLGRRILDPRNYPTVQTNPKVKLGWVGTNKVFNGDNPRPENASNLGKQLLFPLSSPTPQTPNNLRPVTRAEQRLDRQLEARRAKYLKAQNDAQWLTASYGDALAKDGADLSPAERRHMRRTSRRIQRQEARAARQLAKFKKIAGI